MIPLETIDLHGVPRIGVATLQVSMTADTGLVADGGEAGEATMLCVT